MTVPKPKSLRSLWLPVWILVILGVLSLPGTVASAADLAFGTVTLGSSGLVKTATITNTGTVSLTSVAISKGGTHPGDFTVGPLSSTTVPAGGTATFTVTFVPGAAGSRSAVLQPTANLPIAPINLTGTGLLDTTPGSVDGLSVPIVGNRALAAVLQPDGKTILAGSFTSVLGVARTNIARLNADGSLDADFDPNVNNVVHGVAVQADGKILIAGKFTAIQPNAAVAATMRNRIARLNSDGSLDAGFDPNASVVSHK